MITLKGVKGGKDRTGFVSLTFAFLAQDTTPEDALEAHLPAPTSLPEVGRSIGEWDVDNSSFIVNATFEGLLSEPKEDSAEYSIEGEFSEEPIETHPKLDALMKQYQGTRGDDGRVQFAERLSSGRSSAGTGLSGAKPSSSDINPMFGVTTFPAMHVVASRTRTVRRLPASAWQRPGSIVNSLPTGFQEPGGKKWINMPPIANKRGDAWRLQERWKDIGTDRHSELLAKLIEL